MWAESDGRASYARRRIAQSRGRPRLRASRSGSADCFFLSFSEGGLGGGRRAKVARAALGDASLSQEASLGRAAARAPSASCSFLCFGMSMCCYSRALALDGGLGAPLRTSARPDAFSSLFPERGLGGGRRAKVARAALGDASLRQVAGLACALCAPARPAAFSSLFRSVGLVGGGERRSRRAACAICDWWEQPGSRRIGRV